ncbi:MAG: hypothetical protein EI684_21210 [Candidatus Viridilinea halotolerans]|uniref:Uncharacterized protein n=1 Tax=Candidatus Viridilinea halotolerans TaxID=2491704 RepID=A0A426TRK5_9CHLR|nr:MAG: hypothetical protein EI684_21210 [Candidatus Viridilinea halotolerans]
MHHRRRRRIAHRTPPSCVRRRVVFNYELGWDSTAILLRWLLHPETRDFHLNQMIVIIAQVGEEFAGTKRLVEQIIFPLLTQHRIRTVQVARAGPSDKDGITVLSDTRAPSVCHTEGAWRLGDHLMRDGTAPQYANGRHFCAQRFKGWPIAKWVTQELRGRRYRSIIGYHAEEPKRAAKAADYADIQRTHEFPLIAWGWGRAASRYTAIVTTGAMTIEALDQFGHYLDGMSLDLRGFSESSYARIGGIPDWRGVLAVAEHARQQWKCHLEVTTRVHHGVNDSPEELRTLVNWISDQLGQHTPWHVLPGNAGSETMASAMRARRLGFEGGLHYVYGGEPHQPTCCPACHHTLITRTGGVTRLVGLNGTACEACGHESRLHLSIFKPR